MATGNWLSSLFTPRAALRVGVLALTVGLVAPQLWAWRHFRAGVDALAQYHPADALQALRRCEAVWPGSVEVHLLLSRAARQDGDLEVADGELRAAQRLSGAATPATELEWALLQAAGGNIREVDEYLQKQVNRSPEVGRLVWEALTEGYLRIYRTRDAMDCVEAWLKREPNNVRALELRARTYVTGKGVVRGAEDYRKVVELDPSRDQARWRLIECLINLGAYDEAARHLEHRARQHPDDPEVAARLARCYNVLNRRDEARQLLARALAAHPDDPSCLLVRGQIALTDPQDPQAAEAEPLIRRAAAARPEDYQTQWLLFEALRRLGKAEEAKAQLQVAEAVKDRAERLGELRSRKLTEQPDDPALHYEMGALLIKTGHPDVGESWLRTAIGLDPDHKPSHAALADLYRQRGDAARAEEHRRKAAP